MTATPVDIFSMLNKAQTEYNNNVNNSSSQHNTSNVSSNVSAFFASVKAPAANVMNDKMPDVPVHHGVPIFQHHIIQNHTVQVQPHPQQQQQPVNFVNIDQIEKQQMQPGVGVSNNVDIVRPPTHPTDLANSPLANFLNASNLNTLNNNVMVPGIRNVAPSPQMPFPSQQQILHHPEESNLLNGNLLQQHHPEIKVPVQKTISAPPGFSENSNKPLRNLLKENSNINNNNNNKPSLIPPTMFVPSVVPAPGPMPINNDCKPSTPTFFKPEPLTRNQLMQALNYLIENDDDFMKKLHEAYLKSFNSMVTL